MPANKRASACIPIIDFNAIRHHHVKSALHRIPMKKLSSLPTKNTTTRIANTALQSPSRGIPPLLMAGSAAFTALRFLGMLEIFNTITTSTFFFSAVAPFPAHVLDAPVDALPENAPL
ncbi:hypothetical protein BU15DRAFT_74598 [Melanogaster broomeanus]|nr:hypothetical protein BU15DRAFT_74598 [Melanogaster broomeanus]